MRSVRFLVLAAAVAAAGCGSSNNNNNGGNNNAGSNGSAGGIGGTGTSGGGSTGSNGGAGNTGSGGGASGTGKGGASGGGGMSGGGGTTGSNGGAYKTCSQTTGTACKQSDLDAYDNCVLSKCLADYTPCLGNQIAQGKFSGPCGPYTTCTQKCACGDNACRVACGSPSMECLNCETTAAASCMKSCPLPSCFLTPVQRDGGIPGLPGLPDGGLGGLFGDAGAGGTCADLQKCCDTATDPQTKAAICQQAMALKNLGDAACGVVYAAAKSAGACK